MGVFKKIRIMIAELLLHVVLVIFPDSPEKRVYADLLVAYTNWALKRSP